MNQSIERVKEELNKLNVKFEILEFETTTKTALDAARAIGCDLSQIVKSLVFRDKSSDSAVLFLVSGSHKLNVLKVCDSLKLSIEKADADFVKEKTGFPIGGVPPIAHKERLKTFMDPLLLEFDEVWAAAGTPNSVFRISSKVLQRITNAEVIDLF